MKNPRLSCRGMQEKCNGNVDMMETFLPTAPGLSANLVFLLHFNTKAVFQVPC